MAKKNLEYEDDPSRYLDENGRVRSFRDLTDLNDPTLNDDKDGLDMDKLANVQMYGYEKYNKNKRKVNKFIITPLLISFNHSLISKLL